MGAESRGRAAERQQSTATRRAVLSAILVTALTSCTGRPNCRDKCSKPTTATAKSKQILAFDRAFSEITARGQFGPTVNNESGGLAWGQSYLCQSLLRSFEATGDAHYLDEFVRRANWIVDMTDRARGVTDYLGRSGPVWRENYNTAAQAPLKSADGEPIIYIRYAGERSGEAYATVLPGVAADSFTIQLTHPMRGSVRLAEVSTDPQSPRFIESIVFQDAYRTNAPWTAVVRRQGVPKPGRFTLAPSYYVGAVETGMIAYPLARYARMILGDPSLSRGPRRASGERFLRAAEDAVAFHNKEWSVEGDLAAGYKSTKGSPVFADGCQLPFNRSHAMGQTLVELFRATKAPDYAEKVHALVRTWRAAMQPGSHGGATWNFWPPFSWIFSGYDIKDRVSLYTPQMHPIQVMEDISHGAITAEFLVAAHNAGIAVTDDDLEVLVGAYIKEFCLGTESVRWRFDGGAAQPVRAVQCARWMGLADKNVAHHIASVMDRIGPRPNRTSIVLGQAYLAWAVGRGLY